MFRPNVKLVLEPGAGARIVDDLNQRTLSLTPTEGRLLALMGPGSTVEGLAAAAKGAGIDLEAKQIEALLSRLHSNELIDYTPSTAAKVSQPNLLPDDRVPAFRTDLGVEPAPKPGLMLVTDRKRDRSFTVYDFEVNIARLLDGRHTVSQVIESAGKIGIPMTPESLSKFIGQMKAYGFIVEGVVAAPAQSDPTWPVRAEWSSEIRELYQSALRQFRQGRPGHAIEYLDALLEIQPQTPEAIALKRRVEAHQQNGPVTELSFDDLHGIEEPMPSLVAASEPLMGGSGEHRALEPTPGPAPSKAAGKSGEQPALKPKGPIWSPPAKTGAERSPVEAAPAPSGKTGEQPAARPSAPKSAALLEPEPLETKVAAPKRSGPVWSPSGKSGEQPALKVEPKPRPSAPEPTVLSKPLEGDEGMPTAMMPALGADSASPIGEPTAMVPALGEVPARSSGIVFTPARNEVATDVVAPAEKPRAPIFPPRASPRMPRAADAGSSGLATFPPRTGEVPAVGGGDAKPPRASPSTGASSAATLPPRATRPTEVMASVGPTPEAPHASRPTEPMTGAGPVPEAPPASRPTEHELPSSAGVPGGPRPEPLGFAKTVITRPSAPIVVAKPESSERPPPPILVPTDPGAFAKTVITRPSRPAQPAPFVAERLPPAEEFRSDAPSEPTQVAPAPRRSSPRDATVEVAAAAPVGAAPTAEEAKPSPRRSAPRTRTGESPVSPLGAPHTDVMGLAQSMPERTVIGPPPTHAEVKTEPVGGQAEGAEAAAAPTEALAPARPSAARRPTGGRTPKVEEGAPKRAPFIIGGAAAVLLGLLFPIPAVQRLDVQLVTTAKATPKMQAGVFGELKVQSGARVDEGAVIATLDVSRSKAEREELLKTAARLDESAAKALSKTNPATLKKAKLAAVKAQADLNKAKAGVAKAKDRAKAELDVARKEAALEKAERLAVAFDFGDKAKALKREATATKDKAAKLQARIDRAFVTAPASGVFELDALPPAGAQFDEGTPFGRIVDQVLVVKGAPDDAKDAVLIYGDRRVPLFAVDKRADGLTVPFQGGVKPGPAVLEVSRGYRPWPMVVLAR